MRWFSVLCLFDWSNKTQSVWTEILISRDLQLKIWTTTVKPGKHFERYRQNTLFSFTQSIAHCSSKLIKVKDQLISLFHNQPFELQCFYVIILFDKVGDVLTLRNWIICYKQTWITWNKQSLDWNKLDHIVASQPVCNIAVPVVDNMSNTHWLSVWESLETVNKSS